MLLVRPSIDPVRFDRLEQKSGADIVCLGRTSTRRVTGAASIPSLLKRKKCSRTAVPQYTVRVVKLGFTLVCTPILTRLGEEIATTMHELEQEKEKLRSNPDKLLVLFREMVQMCLWQAYYLSSCSSDVSA